MRFAHAIASAAALVALLSTVGCSRSGLFRQYEYEEDVALALDGTATVYVNGSLAAIDALRGASFSTAPNAPFDREAVRSYYTSPVTRVTQISESRRSNRRFVHVKVEVSDVKRLGEAAPFAWSAYRFTELDDRFEYRQSVGEPAAKDIGPVNWTGRELTAFRLRLPSNPIAHNAGEKNHLRGNILVWEQPLADRLRGRPVEMIVQMETESILAHTLLIFGATAVGVAVAFGLVVWLIARRGQPKFAGN